jgi:superfamily II DNA or RNA helicase
MTAPPVEFTGDRMLVRFERFDLAAYRLFLKCKQLPETAVEFDPAAESYTLSAPARFAPLLGVVRPPTRLPQELSSFLHDDQKELVGTAFDAKRYALWCACGWGKTLAGLEWSRLVTLATGGRVLITTLNDVVGEWTREAARWYGDALPLVRLGSRADMREWMRDGPAGEVGITNYEKWNPDGLADQVVPEAKFLSGAVLDECFPKGTLVDVVRDGERCETAIENVRSGDSILNAAGVDVVASAHRREVQYAVRVSFAGRAVISSPDHPWLTPRGWVHARDLVPGDRLVSAAAGVRVVRGDLPPGLQAAEQAFLRKVLLSEMADAPAGTPCEGLQPGCPPEAGGGGGPVHELAGVGGTAGGGLAPVKGGPPETFRAWGQRQRFDAPPEDLAGCTWADLGDGVVCLTGPTTARISHTLQDRLGAARQANRYRGGWQIPPGGGAAGPGPEEGRDPGVPRVDGLEVLEPGHPDLEQFRDAGGKLHFYDLDGTRHPSFSVSGVLVHNNRLKTGGGVQKWALGKSMKGIEYKLSLTATPAPNATMEFASQAMWLEKMRSDNEIIWTFFTRDPKTHRWQVKPHARAAFFEWMSSWSVYVNDPTRYGWRAGTPAVPRPVYRTIDVPATDEQRELARVLTADGDRMTLFADAETNTIQRAKLSQVAKGFRYVRKTGKQTVVRVPSHKPKAVADLVRQEVSAGAQVLVWTVFDAETDILLAELAGVPAVEALTGKTPAADRPAVLDRCRAGATRALVTRAAVLGWGMNLQMFAAMVFSGWTDSFEQLYQAVRRAYRSGQTERVRVYFPVVRELEGDSLDNLDRKEAEFERSISDMEDNYLRARARLTGKAVSA